MMQALHGELLLTAWERCRPMQGPRRALAMLAAAEGNADCDQLAELPLAELNTRLFALRIATFGRRLEGFTLCTHCGASLEFGVDAAELQSSLTASTSSDARLLRPMRPMTSADLLTCLSVESAEEMRRILLTRTTLHSDPAQSNGELPESLAELECAFEEVNANAQVLLELACGECGQSSIFDLDIAGFLWHELRTAASRLLQDVHTLASSYGWSEREILALPPARRSAYLEMVNA